ncbi:MAG TPA: hypothetical protein VFF13_00410 [archaeon]|nr:hypothetical protein [archaeon]
MVKKMPSVFEPEGTALYVFLVIMLTFGMLAVIHQPFPPSGFAVAKCSPWPECRDSGSTDVGSDDTGEDSGTVTAAQKSTCIAQTNDTTINIGSDFLNNEEITLESCYNLTGNHNRRILDNFCSNSGVMQDIEIKWGDSTINTIKLDCPTISLSDNTPITLTGELGIAKSDNFETGEQKYYYTINDLATNEMIELNVKDQSKKDKFLETFSTGEQVKVRGVAKKKTNFQKENGLSEYELEIAGLGNENIRQNNGGFLASVPAQNERTIITVLVNFLDQSTTVDKSVLETNMFGDNNSVDDLYRRTSFGNTGFKRDTNGDGGADIFGPVTIDYTVSGTTCDAFNSWASSAESEMQEQGVNLSLYTHKLFIVPNSFVNKCGWAGLAYVAACPGTYCRAWVVDNYASTYPGVVAHELGHNIGFHHAATDLGNDGVIDNEYGDASDFMGTGSYNVGMVQLNAPHETQFSWIPSSKVLTLTDPGTYTISALKVPPLDAPNPTVARFLKADGKYLYFAYRIATGYDSTLNATYKNKLNIHWRSPTVNAGKTHFIKALIPGQSFTDIASSMRVTMDSNTADTATFTFTPGNDCFKANPTVSVTPAIASSQSGTTLEYNVSITNRYSVACPVTTFNLTRILPTGWTGSFANNSITLSSNATGSTSLSVTSPIGTVDSYYDVNVSGRDSNTLSPNFGKAAARAVIDSIPPSTPSNLTAQIGTGNNKNKILLAWGISTDNYDTVPTYTIYRNNIQLTTTTSNSFKDATDLSIANTYYVTATDNAGNISPSSNTAMVQPQSSGGGSTPSYQCSDAKDNDGDSVCDYTGCYIGKGRNKVLVASDPQCTSATYNSESS